MTTGWLPENGKSFIHLENYSVKLNLLTIKETATEFITVKTEA